MTTLTPEEVTAWLEDPAAIRGTLVEVAVRPFGESTDITRYLSSFGYTTNGADIPAHTAYEAALRGSVKYTERFDITGSGALSVGDIEINNITGEYDSWLNDVWVNRNIKAYVGDIKWSRDKFIQIFDGVVADIDSRNLQSITIKVRDKVQRLNTPISELNYSDIYPYPASSNLTPHYDPTDPNNVVPDLAIPMAFGELHNVTPILVDKANLVYMLNYGTINGIVEVRDNGIPLVLNKGYTVDVSKGTITMLYSPMGTLTVSVQGDATGTYSNTAASLIRKLVISYGKVVPNPTTGAPTTRSGTMIPGSSPPIGYPIVTPSPDRFVEGTDIDTANFDAFNSANTQPLGVYVPSKENLLSTCQWLANSVGASLCLTRSGKLKLLKLSSPPVGTPIVISKDMYKFGSLQIVDRTNVSGAIKLGYNKNWTVEANLLTDIPVEHRRIFAEEWSTIGVFNSTAITTYKLTGLPAQENTLLLTQYDAAIEAARRLSLWSVPHTIYKVTGTSVLLDLQLGDPVQLIGSRYGLTGATGVGVGTVISLQPNWSTGVASVDVEIFI